MQLDGFVVGVEGGLKKEDGGDATGHFLDVTHFVFGEGASEERLFAIGKPFFYDLIAADRVAPDAGRNVAPVCYLLDVDVLRLLAQMAGCPG